MGVAVGGIGGDGGVVEGRSIWKIGVFWCGWVFWCVGRDVVVVQIGVWGIGRNGCTAGCAGV